MPQEESQTSKVPLADPPTYLRWTESQIETIPPKLQHHCPWVPAPWRWWENNGSESRFTFRTRHILTYSGLFFVGTHPILLESKKNEMKKTLTWPRPKWRGSDMTEGETKILQLSISGAAPATRIHDTSEGFTVIHDTHWYTTSTLKPTRQICLILQHLSIRSMLIGLMLGWKDPSFFAQYYSVSFISVGTGERLE